MEENPIRYRTVQNVCANLPPLQVIDEYDADAEEFYLVATEEPWDVEQALGEEKWRMAMEEEMKAIHDNKTWELTSLPPSQKAIRLKWVFKLKKNPEGKVIRHKARLVAKGYVQ